MRAREPERDEGAVVREGASSADRKRQPVLVDLYCCGGGAGRGYELAGFRVVGVDIVERLACPFPMIVASALDVLESDDPAAFINAGLGLFDEPIDRIDAWHASPPCQRFTRAAALRDAQGGQCSSLDLLEPTRRLLIETGQPYVIENVQGAPLIDPVTYSGSMFGLAVQRHRLFESSVPLVAPKCDHKTKAWPNGKPIGVYHTMGDTVQGTCKKTGKYVVGGSTAKTLEEGQKAMGIDWLPWDLLREAIPPAYTRHIGEQLLEHMRAAA